MQICEHKILWKRQLTFSVSILLFKVLCKDSLAIIHVHFILFPFKNTYLALHFQRRLNKSLILIHSLTCTLIHWMCIGKLLDFRLYCSCGATKVNKTWPQPSRDLYSSRRAKQMFFLCFIFCQGRPFTCVRTYCEKATVPHMTHLEELTSICSEHTCTCYFFKRYLGLIHRIKCINIFTIIFTKHFLIWVILVVFLQKRVTFYQYFIRRFLFL